MRHIKVTKPLADLSPNTIKKLAIVRNGGGRSVLQGLYLTAAYAKYRSTERMNARDLILSDSAPKNKLIYQNTMVFGLHQKLHIPKYGC